MHSLGTESFSKATAVCKHELWGKSYKSILPSNCFVPFSVLREHSSETLPKGIFIDSFDDEGFEEYMYIDATFMLVNEGRKLKVWIIDDSALHVRKGYPNFNSLKAQLLLRLYSSKNLNFCRYTSEKSKFEHLAYSFIVDHGPIEKLSRDALRINSYVDSTLRIYAQFRSNFNRLGIKLKPNMPTPSNVSYLVIPFIDNSSYIKIKDGIKAEQIFGITNP